MAEGKWALISTGEKFEALVTTLIFFEDPQAALFGRRGKDGGQDARSGNDAIVYQAKHHMDGSAAKAIRDAISEARKIADYRKPGHTRYNQWKDIQHWRLVTNAEFNPADRDKWSNEVVPLFKAMGLSVDYWERATLDALLLKYPEVERAYFQNEPRTFLTLPEAREYLIQSEPFLHRTESTAFFGRETEMAAINSFLASDKIFLVIHGAGGIGKTRFMIEAGERIASNGTWQVLWVNVASMSSYRGWFDSINTDRPTLLLVDEPDDAELLQILSEQLGFRVGRTKQWKVALTVRSPKDPILRFLFAPRVKERIQELLINTLTNASAIDMCADLIGSGPLANQPETWRKDAVNKLAQRFSQHPIWLTLAVHLLEMHGDLTKIPQTSSDLVAQYLDEIVTLQQQSAADTILNLLRWVALLGTVNRQDEASINLLSEWISLGDKSAVLSMLDSLVKRRVLVQRGAYNRLVEIKPDVLRDHILMKWLTVDAGFGPVSAQPSDQAKALVDDILKAIFEGSITPLIRESLKSLARIELILKLAGKPVPLLDPFFKGILDGLKLSTASQRIEIAEAITNIAAYRPMNAVEICRALRRSTVKKETIKGLLGDIEFDQDNIIMELPWLVYTAALGAKDVQEGEKVIEELCALAELEQEIATRRPRGLPNDGKRAGQLIRRVIEGGPQFLVVFDEAVRTVVNRWLDNILSAPLSHGKIRVIEALLEPLAALERRQTWSEGYKIHLQNYIIAPESTAWKLRTDVLVRIRNFLADITAPIEVRILFWHIVAEAHRSMGQCRGRGNLDFQELLRKMQLDDLTWAYSVLSVRKDMLEELKAARNLWDWHYQFEEKYPELKDASNKLEELYLSSDLVSEFEQLLSYGTRSQANVAIAQKASALADCKESECIKNFLDRAKNFLRDDREFYRLYRVAWSLGEKVSASNTVSNFVRSTMAEAIVTPYAEFAAEIAASWLAWLRRNSSPEEAYNLVKDLLNVCGSDSQKMLLIQRTYDIFRSLEFFNAISSAEQDHLRSFASLFIENKKGPEYIKVIAWTFPHNWSAFRELIENILHEIPEEQLRTALEILAEYIYWGIHDGKLKAPADISKWLLDQLLLTTDFDDFDHQIDWHIKEILRKTDKIPLNWLISALTKRRGMEAEDASKKIRAVCNRIRLSAYVSQISSDQVDDPDVIEASKELVDFLTDRGSIGYYMPDMLHDLDPEGLIIPAEIVRRIGYASNRDDVWVFARVAGTYTMGSQGWRIIAKPVIQYALRQANEKDRKSLFSILLESGIRSWSGTIGEVPQLFFDEVKTARRFLETESDSDFRPFWEWKLSVAEAELRSQEEQVKEDFIDE